MEGEQAALTPGAGNLAPAEEPALARPPRGGGDEGTAGATLISGGTGGAVLAAAQGGAGAPMEAALGPKSTGVAMEEPEFEVAADYSVEPLADRLASRDLGRRCSAYVELQARMEAAAPDAEAFLLFWSHLDGCIAESLPKGQDAGLSALAVYLDRCPDVGADQVLPLVRRLLEHKAIDKPKMQQLVPCVVLAATEICEGPAVMKEIIDCLADLENAKKKTQGFFKKQVAFAIRLMYCLLADFGPQRVSPKLGYLSVVLKFASDSDRGIREACYAVLVELSTWLGDISEAVKSMDEPQKKELAKRVADLKDEERTRSESKRHYRSEKAAVPASGSCGGGGSSSSASGQDGRAAASLDTYDMLEATDALKKLPKGWSVDKVLTMEKWKEKQVHLQQLAIAVDVSRLQPSEVYATMVPTLQRLLKTESNIPVVTEAAKCVGLIAKGLRKEFERWGKQLLRVFLARINDKSVWRPNVLVERVEQLLWSVSFELLLEELRPHVASKSLFAKKEAMSLLLRSLDLPAVQQGLAGEPAQLFFLPLVSMLLPNVDDADNTVRQEAARFLATLTLRNRESCELGPALLEKLPTHRRHFFDEEVRKLAGEQGISDSLLTSSGSGDACTTRAPATSVTEVAHDRAAPKPGPTPLPVESAKPAASPAPPVAKPAPPASLSGSAATPAPLALESTESAVVQEMARQIQILQCEMQALREQAQAREQELPSSRLRAPQPTARTSHCVQRSASSDGLRRVPRTQSAGRFGTPTRERPVEADLQGGASPTPARRMGPLTPSRRRVASSGPAATVRAATPGTVRQPSRLSAAPPPATPRASATPKKEMPRLSGPAAAAAPPSRLRSPSASAGLGITSPGQAAGPAARRMREPSPLQDRRAPAQPADTPSISSLPLGSTGSADLGEPRSARGDTNVSVSQLLQRLVQCSDSEYKELCGSLAEVFTGGKPFDSAPELAEQLLLAMRANFGPDSPSWQVRCEPTVALVEAFCARKECRTLPDRLIAGLLQELLRKLNSSSWTSFVDGGKDLLRRLNLACVILLTTISRPSANSRLLEVAVGADGDRGIRSLVVKCLKKVNRNISTSRDVARDVWDILDVLPHFVRHSHSQLAQNTDAEVFIKELVREVAQAAQAASPEAFREWLARRLGRGSDACRERWGLSDAERELLQELLEEPQEKENDAPEAMLGSGIRGDKALTGDGGKAPAADGPTQQVLEPSVARNAPVRC